jgi:pimeloyl-ACP methyl ester carboxylesterase
MFPTRLVRNSFRQLPHRETVPLAYDLHVPQRSLFQNLNDNQKEPILFVHGIFGSKKSYTLDSKLIADFTHTPVYTVDLRNHGQSGHAMPFDYDTLSQDIKEFCSQHGLKSVKLVGYSLGAKISMLTALRFPKLVKSAVIIDNAPVKQPYIEHYMKQYVKSMIHVLEETKIKKNDKDWKNKASIAMKKFLPNGVVRRNLLVNLVNKKPDGFESPVVDFEDGSIQFLNPVRHMAEMVVKDVADWPVETTKDLQFRGPVKFIRGLKSPFINDEGMSKINEHFPNNDIVSVNSAHDILDQRPHEYVKIISDFFNIHRYQSAPESTVIGHREFQMRTEMRM